MAGQLALGLSLSGDGAAPARLRARSQPLFAQGFARRIELRRAGGEWIAVGDEVADLQAPRLYTSHGAGDVRVYADRAVLARAQRRTWLDGSVRSAERRGGEQCFRTCRSRRSTYTDTQKQLNNNTNNTNP